MKLKLRRLAIIPILLLILPFILNTASVEAQPQAEPALKVAVSVPSLATIIKDIGGDIVAVSSLLDQEADPHADRCPRTACRSAGREPCSKYPESRGPCPERQAALRSGFSPSMSIVSQRSSSFQFFLVFTISSAARRAAIRRSDGVP